MDPKPDVCKGHTGRAWRTALRSRWRAEHEQARRLPKQPAIQFLCRAIEDDADPKHCARDNDPTADRTVILAATIPRVGRTNNDLVAYPEVFKRRSKGHTEFAILKDWILQFFFSLTDNN